MKARVSQIFQVLLAAAAWVAFGAMWWWAFAHRGPLAHQLRDLAIVAIFSLLVLVLTSFWVRYNVGIYRRKGPRMRIPEGDRDYSKDTIGRPVLADFDTLAYERNVIIDIVDGPHGPVKTYTAIDIPADAGEEAACTMSYSA